MTVRVGILGAGNISGTHARAAREIPGVEIAAVLDRSAERAEALAAEHGAAAYTDQDAFLAHRPMDLVLIGSPSGLHAEQASAAARAGLHVLVEKPLDVATDKIDTLIAESDRAGVKVGVFFQDRGSPHIAWLKRLVDSGGLGRPLLASARVKWYRPPEYYGASPWRGTWAMDGGGALMNQGVHTVDLLCWLLGDVERVSARAATLVHDIEVEDTAVATLQFASGALATLEATTAAYPGYPRRLELTGTEGTVVLEHDQVIAVDLMTPPAEPLPEAQGNQNASASTAVVSDVSGHRRILEDFLRAIETDGTPMCDARSGRRSIALIEAIYASARTGEATRPTPGR